MLILALTVPQAADPTPRANDPAIGSKPASDAVCAAVVHTRDALLQQAVLLADSRADLTDAQRAYSYFGQAPGDPEIQAEIDKADTQARAVLLRLERADRINRDSRAQLDGLTEQCFGLVPSPLD